MARNEYRYGMPTLIGTNVRGSNLALFDLHNANRNNEPPLTLFTGKPGSGKTFSMLWILSQAALQGAAVVGIDWKGDLLQIREIRDVFGVETKTIRVDPKDPANRGILDPFVVFDNSEDKEQAYADIVNAVHAVCHALLPGSLEKHSISAFVDSAINDVIRGFSEEKSMPVFLRRLENVSRQTDNNDLTAFALALRSKLRGSGVLLSAEPDGERDNYFEFKPGVTVIDLSNLPELPQTIEELKNPSKAVGQAILTMITLLVRQSMFRMPKNIRKVLAIDEAWSILANPAGLELVKSTVRLGRSLNLAVVLGTQSYADVFAGAAELDTSFASTHFAFGNSKKDGFLGATAMGLEGETAEQVANAISVLEQGNCIMHDIRKRTGQVRIQVWLQELIEAFSTNPYDTKNTQPTPGEPH